MPAIQLNGRHLQGNLELKITLVMTSGPICSWSQSSVNRSSSFSSLTMYHPNWMRKQEQQSIIHQETKLALLSHAPWLACTSCLNKYAAINPISPNQHDMTQAHDSFFIIPPFATSRLTIYVTKHLWIQANLSFLSDSTSQTSLYSLAFH
jgi:hypothetical protein